MSRKVTHEEFQKKVNDIFGDKVELLEEYKAFHTKMLVRYTECGHEGYKQPCKLLIGQGCGKCKGKAISKAKLRSTDDYLLDLKAHGINNIEVIGEYKGVNEKVRVRNLDCGHEYEANAGNILSGSGCPVCHGMKDTLTFAKQIESKYPNEYTILGEYINNKTPILVRHKCGFEWSVIPKDLLRDRRCPKCIVSKGELFVGDYLKEKGIDFTPQYSFKDCRDKNPLPFDFMIMVDGQMKLIEFDGSQHFAGRSIYYSEIALKHDKIKNDYCESHNIPLLRIPYWWIRNDRATRELDKFTQ
jgi:predicted Zn-ribbon and HTH transcriptional regulator